MNYYKFDNENYLSLGGVRVVLQALGAAKKAFVLC